MVVVVVPALVMFGVLLPLVAFWSRYPDPLAVHWGFSGPPNGEMSLLVYAALLAAGTDPDTGVRSIAGARQSMPSAPLTAVTYFIMGLAGRGQRPDRHRQPGCGVVGGGRRDVGAALHRRVGRRGRRGCHWLVRCRRFPRCPRRRAVGRCIGFDEELVRFGIERVGSARRRAARSSWCCSSIPSGLILMVAIAIVMVAFSSVRVEADEQGVTVNIGPFGWPRSHIPIEEITGAAAFDVKPMAYGGWGYRVRSGVRAFVIRSGPAIRIERSQGPDTLVTVDDAPVGAATDWSAGPTLTIRRRSRRRRRAERRTRAEDGPSP